MSKLPDYECDIPSCKNLFISFGHQVIVDGIGRPYQVCDECLARFLELRVSKLEPLYVCGDIYCPIKS
jgi:hypothetical protein